MNRTNGEIIQGLITRVMDARAKISKIDNVPKSVDKVLMDLQREIVADSIKIAKQRDKVWEGFGEFCESLLNNKNGKTKRPRH
jgi:hypothetical protein